MYGLKGDETISEKLRDGMVSFSNGVLEL